MLGILTEILVCLILALLILGIIVSVVVLAGLIIEEICENNNGIFHRIGEIIFIIFL